MLTPTHPSNPEQYIALVPTPARCRRRPETAGGAEAEVKLRSVPKLGSGLSGASLGRDAAWEFGARANRRRRGSRVSANLSGLKGFGENGVWGGGGGPGELLLLWCFVRPEPDFVFIHNHAPTVWVAPLEPSGLRASSPRGHPRPRVLLSDPSPAAPNKSPFAFPCPSPWV